MSIGNDIFEVQQKLKENGYGKLAGIVADYMEKKGRRDFISLGFVGDDLVGKSTVINAFLGEKVVPETVLPSSAEISIKYGAGKKIRNQEGEDVDEKELLRLIEEDDVVSIAVPNEILRGHGIEIKEFHGLLNKKKMSDMFWMSSIYKCDAVVLVMSAEHLLSENECAFIDNFVQYVGAEHLLLVVNRLNMVANSDIVRILEYAQKQILIKFPGVKWIVNDPESGFSDIISKYASIDVNSGIVGLCGASNNPETDENDSIIRYVYDELLAEIENLKDKQGKSEEEIRAVNRKILEQKELEKATVEMSLLEFAQRKNTAVDAADAFIQKEFGNITENLLKEYANAVDKYAWYRDELEERWKKDVYASSEKADQFIAERVSEDVEWLNGILNTSLNSGGITVGVLDRQVKGPDKLTPYGTYKKFVPIGMGGGVIIGYCLFRLVGAVIGLGGGALAFSYLKFKETAQDEEIQRGIAAQIRDISSEVRKLTKMDIGKLYDGVLAEFKKEADNLLDSKYRTVDISADGYENKINALQEIITKVEG